MNRFETLPVDPLRRCPPSFDPDGGSSPSEVAAELAVSGQRRRTVLFEDSVQSGAPAARPRACSSVGARVRGGAPDAAWMDASLASISEPPLTVLGLEVASSVADEQDRAPVETGAARAPGAPQQAPPGRGPRRGEPLSTHSQSPIWAPGRPLPAAPAAGGSSVWRDSEDVSAADDALPPRPVPSPGPAATWWAARSGVAPSPPPPEAACVVLLADLPHTATQAQVWSACFAHGSLVGDPLLLPPQRVLRRDDSRAPPSRLALVRFEHPGPALALCSGQAALRIGCRRVTAVRPPAELLSDLPSALARAAAFRRSEFPAGRRQWGVRVTTAAAALAAVAAVAVPQRELQIEAQLAAEFRALAELVLRAYDEDGDGLLNRAEWTCLCGEVEDLDPDLFSAMCERHGGVRDSKGRWAGLGLQSLLRLSGVVAVAAVAAAGRLAAAAVGVEAGACAEKHDDEAVGSRLCFAVEDAAARLEQIWREKEGDVIDELASNLKTPAGLAKMKMKFFGESARALQRRAGALYPNASPAGLLVMALYTMAGWDIDALMGFDDVPKSSDQQGLDKYKKTKTKRNAALFSTVNRTMRDAGNDPAAPETAGSTWATVRKWVKTIALLIALSLTSAPPPEGEQGRPAAPPRTPRSPPMEPPDDLADGDSKEAKVSGELFLYRGLAGLPGAVVDAHRELRPGQSLQWAAPSSCAMDPQISRDYVSGAAANATTSTQEGSSGTVFFTIRAVEAGLPLAGVSKYPKEAEVLLPALSTFLVTSKSAGGPGLPDDCVTLSLRAAPSPVDMSDFVRAVLREAEGASLKLAPIRKPARKAKVPLLGSPVKGRPGEQRRGKPSSPAMPASPAKRKTGPSGSPARAPAALKAAEDPPTPHSAVARSWSSLSTATTATAQARMRAKSRASGSPHGSPKGPRQPRRAPGLGGTMRK